MGFPVRLETVAPGLIAAVHRRTTFAEVPRVLIAGLDVVWAFIRSNSLRHGRNVAIYRPLGGGAVDLTCGVQVLTRFDDEAEVSCVETPAGRAAAATHVGPYDRLGECYDAIAGWAKSNGHRPAGVNWEVYGRGDAEPAKLTTEVYVLLQSD